MLTVERNIQIHRTPQEVWPWVAWPEGAEQWLQTATAVSSDTDGEAGIGDRWTYHQRFLGVSLDSVAEVTAAEAPRHLHHVAVRAPFTWTSDITIEPSSDGCVVTLRVEAPEGLGGIFRHADSLVVRRFRATTDTGLRCLKELVENESGNTPSSGAGEAHHDTSPHVEGSGEPVLRATRRAFAIGLATVALAVGASAATAEVIEGTHAVPFEQTDHGSGGTLSGAQTDVAGASVLQECGDTSG